MAESTEVLYEVADHVATISLNRPDRGNAATFDLGEQFQAALRRADGDPDVRAIVLTGKGRHFCTGDDVEAAWGDPRIEPRPSASSATPAHRSRPQARALLDCRVPTIAAVNGAALGIGMDLAILCDIVIAGERAKFGQLFVKMGLMADFTGYWRLPQLVGLAKAGELMFTGDIVDAAEAERIGLVSRVVPDDELMTAAGVVAARIAAQPPLSIRYIKEGIRRGAGPATAISTSWPPSSATACRGSSPVQGPRRSRRRIHGEAPGRVRRALSETIGGRT